ncbi:MAG: hypothetical protein H6832_09440 [Planctomycetes bacterium]|nr:hypothetical protein [Planctomycetota bacterium]
MQRRMQDVMRNTERAATAIAARDVLAWKAAARRIELLLNAPEARSASSEPGWGGILGQVLEAARSIQNSASASAAGSAFEALEAACWRCHDRFVVKGASRRVQWAER